MMKFLDSFRICWEGDLLRIAQKSIHVFVASYELYTML